MLTSNITLKKHEEGFTLIELSIVLVIIGLIVGGILTGQDLIKAAQIRAEVSQLENYNTAVNTFHGKYNGIPGDLLSGSSFFSSVTDQSAGTLGEGNGDGLVQSISAAGTPCTTNYDCLAGENVVFWYELNAAGLIPDSTNKGFDYTAALSVSPSVIPTGKIPGNNIMVNAGSTGYNYWVLAKVTGSGMTPTYGGGLTTIQAFQLDTKVDDGLPATGTVVSLAATPSPGVPADVSATAASGCTNAASTTITSANVYNTALYANNVNCIISDRTNF